MSFKKDDRVRLVRILGGPGHRLTLGPFGGRAGVVEHVGEPLPMRNPPPSVRVRFDGGPEGVVYYCHAEELEEVGE